MLVRMKGDDEGARNEVLVWIAPKHTRTCTAMQHVEDSGLPLSHEIERERDRIDSPHAME